MKKRRREEIVGWALQKQLYEGLAARPGLFSMQETALLDFLLHKQYGEFGSFKKQTRTELAAIWDVSPEHLRQLIVKLEMKRALSRIGVGNRKQEFAVTLRLAFAYYDERSDGKTPTGVAPNPACPYPQAGLPLPPSLLAPSPPSDLSDLSDQYVQEATASPRPPPPPSDTPLLDGVPLQIKPDDPRHARLLEARADVIRKLRERLRGLIKQLLHNPGLAARFNGGSAIESESALDHALRGICAKKRVVGWQDHVHDVLTPTVSFEWTKHRVVSGAESEYPSHAARRRRGRS